MVNKRIVQNLVHDMYNIKIVNAQHAKCVYNYKKN